jgi:hypothetical protein
MSNFQKPTDDLASLTSAPNLKFEREDWTSFRTVEGLMQKGGVSKSRLPRLVLKELADNGLDNTGADIEVGERLGGGYYVQDNGPGLDETPEGIARLFNRKMVSTKLLRLPQRGALGNGLRVVAGAVLASEGSLIVTTRNRRIELRPEYRDGSTTIVSVKPVKFPVGTKVEIVFGPALPCDNSTLSWAKAARWFNVGEKYTGKSSPFWYDAPQFLQLLSASPDTLLVRELIAELDGCSGGKAGEIVNAADLQRTLCKDVTREQAADLLKIARLRAKAVTPQRLGAVGDIFRDHAYARVCGTTAFGSDEPKAEIPFVVEAWAVELKGEHKHDTHLASVSVNRTPVTGNIRAAHNKRDINLFGSNLHHNVAQAPKSAEFSISLDIITPYMPITSDGKEPDLEPFLDEICRAVGNAVRKAHAPHARSGTSEKQVILDHLEEVIADVSGDGEYRFNQRQLFYGLRPFIMEAFNKELQIGNFISVITDYEAEHGEIPGMYREPRGSISHPHREETITLGTLMVESYERPSWLFNKLVYIEKEGANEALKAAGWLERHDCSVMSSKGYGTRAAKDLIDKLAKHKEPITVFAITDADAYGTMIQQTLQEETKARAARNITIINLGLAPWEAIEMGLDVENVEVKQNKDGEDKRKPVADYVKDADESGEHGTAPDGDTWEDWLQGHRVELNAMTTPQFIDWLDAKMADHVGKLVPPEAVIKAELEARLEAAVRGKITERILREAKLERQVKAAMRQIKRPAGRTLIQGIKGMFKSDRAKQWRAHIASAVTDCLKKVS